MGGGGHQHGGGRYGSTSTCTPPAAAPSHVTTVPMSGGGPPPHSGLAHHHRPEPTQHGGYTPSFPSDNSFPCPGRGGDGFSFPWCGTAPFPGGEGVPYPETSLPDASPFLALLLSPMVDTRDRPVVAMKSWTSTPPHLGGYNPHGGDGPPYHASLDPLLGSLTVTRAATEVILIPWTLELILLQGQSIPLST